MTDVVSKAKRSEMMAGIKGKNTKPEMLIRRGLHALGYRFRLHRKELPGRPDIVLPKYKAAIFVNGCFWHGHDCHLFKWPKTREEFWREKIQKNQSRDLANQADCWSLQWRTLVIWECAIKGREKIDLDEILETIQHWIEGNDTSLEIRGLALDESLDRDRRTTH